MNLLLFINISSITMRSTYIKACDYIWADQILKSLTLQRNNHLFTQRQFIHSSLPQFPTQNHTLLISPSPVLTYTFTLIHPSDPISCPLSSPLSPSFIPPPPLQTLFNQPFIQPTKQAMLPAQDTRLGT